jgi:hypothetical protein
MSMLVGVKVGAGAAEKTVAMTASGAAAGSPWL